MASFLKSECNLLPKKIYIYIFTEKYNLQPTQSAQVTTSAKITIVSTPAQTNVVQMLTVMSEIMLPSAVVSN